MEPRDERRGKIMRREKKQTMERKQMGESVEGGEKKKWSQGMKEGKKWSSRRQKRRK